MKNQLFKHTCHSQCKQIHYVLKLKYTWIKNTIIKLSQKKMEKRQFAWFSGGSECHVQELDGGQEGLMRQCTDKQAVIRDMDSEQNTSPYTLTRVHLKIT